MKETKGIQAACGQVDSFIGESKKQNGDQNADLIKAAENIKARLDRLKWQKLNNMMNQMVDKTMAVAVQENDSVWMLSRVIKSGSTCTCKIVSGSADSI